jgi:hypothetical protein
MAAGAYVENMETSSNPQPRVNPRVNPSSVWLVAAILVIEIAALGRVLAGLLGMLSDEDEAEQADRR